MIHYYVYEMPIGRMFLAEENDRLCNVDIDKISYHALMEDRSDAINEETELLREAAEQLREYFDGQRQKFDLPVILQGTDFQIKAWKALMDIPYGETRSYKQQAEYLGNPNACRAVGGANHRNRLLIIVPCHRVIGADGSLIGFGSGLDVKRKLLDLEKNFR